MKISQTQPKTIEEAIEMLYNGMTADEIERAKNYSPANYHHSLGTQLRNNWNFWGESELKQDFINRFELFGHGDDLSGVILDGLFAKCQGRDVGAAIKKTIDSYKRHWLKSGLNPKTGEQIKVIQS